MDLIRKSVLKEKKKRYGHLSSHTYYSIGEKLEFSTHSSKNHTVCNRIKPINDFEIFSKIFK